MKPQRPSTEIKQTPCKCTTTTYIYRIIEHSIDTRIIQNSCRKNCCFVLKMAKCLYFYNGVLELSLDLLIFLLALLFLAHLLKMRSENLFYLRGLFERFPPDSPTLFNYIEWVV
jgi:hypothetical protein